MRLGEVKRIGILGGSFNPIHNGHMSMARGFLNALGLDLVLLIPVWSPPHKSAREMTGADDRLEMCRLACEGDPRIMASNIEIARGGTSYTADTLGELSKIYQGARFFLITGADMFLTLDKWKNFKTISRLAELCACSRNEGELSSLKKFAAVLESNYGARCHVEDLPVVPVSSTLVRSLLKSGGDARQLVPPPVLRYIKSRGLYDSAKEKTGQSSGANIKGEINGSQSY